MFMDNDCPLYSKYGMVEENLSKYLGCMSFVLIGNIFVHFSSQRSIVWSEWQVATQFRLQNGVKFKGNL